MTGKSKITMDVLKQESPFFIPDIAAKYGWNHKTLWAYIHSYKRFHLFDAIKKESDGTSGNPGKQYSVKKK